ncbi:MAG: DNA primase [Gammaproteobacteria bacterium]
MPGRIPQNFIDDLLARTDIVDVIDAVVPLRKAGKNHQALCPFHDEKTPSFTVSQDKQFFHCFGCGANGTAITFLMDFHKIGFVEAVEDLAERAGLEIPREAGRATGDAAFAELHKLLESVVEYYREQLREHRQGRRAIEYLKSRGISDETAAKFGLGYAPAGWDNLISALTQSEADKERLFTAGMIIRREGGGYYDRFRDRIMFPIRDQRGRMIGFGGRVLDDSTPKYLNSPETPIFHKGRELYGLDTARSASMDRLYVVEGYMDVLALNQFGIHCVAATLGTAATRDHLERVFRSTSRLIFCFDGDEAGRRAAWRALETSLPYLRDGRQVFFLFMPEGEDPDTFIRSVGREHFDDSSFHVSLSDHLINTLRAQNDLGHREGRARFLDAALPYLKQLPDGALKQLLAQDLAALANTHSDQLNRLLEVHSRADTRRGREHPAAGTSAPGAANRTLLGRLIQLLISRPALASLVPDTGELRAGGVAGVDFLVELLDFIHSRPQVSSAGILEHWRDSRYEPRLRSLVHGAQDLNSDTVDLESEFLDALTRLGTQAKRRRRQELTRVDRLSDLSEEARVMLKNLRNSGEPSVEK